MALNILLRTALNASTIRVGTPNTNHIPENLGQPTRLFTCATVSQLLQVYACQSTVQDTKGIHASVLA